MNTTQPMLPFSGSTYEHTRDHARLSTQLIKVRNLMADGQWRTLKQIAGIVGGTEASVSARLRDLRKSKHGGLNVEKMYYAGGLWIYRIPKQGVE